MVGNVARERWAAGELHDRRRRPSHRAKRRGRGETAAGADRRSGRTRLASEVGIPDTLLNADKNNFSPRVGFAWRLDESNKTVLRGGFGIFHPTVAVQGVRDLLAATSSGTPTRAAAGNFRTDSRVARCPPPRRLRESGHRPESWRRPMSTSTT